MREASRHLLGRHDFASLVTRPAEPGTTHRTVFAADWLQIAPSLLLFEICADAFLKQMVRTIVGSLLWVGSKRWRPSDFVAAVDAADRRAAGPNAPALGLTLHRIEY
jgi:tRNA pseudouridine38-40 synthase